MVSLLDFSKVLTNHIDPNKKFIYVEMAFFNKWWNEQNENMKKAVKKLVENGQL